MDTVSFTAIFEGFYPDKSYAYLAYRRSEEVEWAALRIESFFSLYYFTSVGVSGLPDGGTYCGRPIYGLRSPRYSAVFPL